MNEAQTKRVIDRVLLLAGKGVATTVSLINSRGGHTRFAVNEVTSSGDVEKLWLSVTIQLGKREASATTNQLDDRAIEDVVARAQRMAKLAPENPEAMPPLGRQKYAAVPKPTDSATEAFGAPGRAKAVAAALSAGKSAQVAMAGYYEHGAYTMGIGTSAGLTAFHAWSGAQMSCTARTADASGSGWAGGQSNRVGDITAEQLAQIAVDKATKSQKARRLEPGRYTVVLEPAAVANMLEYFTSSFDARRADEGRSFFSKPGGGSKIGDKLFPDLVTFKSDPTDAALAANPFDGEGLPLAPTKWIDRGKVNGLYYSRFWAQKQGKQATGRPSAWSLEGGAQTREVLIKDVKRGVLITRFWYIEMVDPQTVLLTGLTRDGTFLIENGAIAGPVNNFRINESPVQMLAKCDALTATALTEGMRVPALRTHDFNLASISEAV